MLIRLEARANDLDVHKTWYRAYHGTSPETVASIFRAGNLFAAGTHILMLNAFCFCLFVFQFYMVAAEKLKGVYMCI